MTRLSILVVLLMAAWLPADTVFLADGRQIRGTVTKTDGKVHIQTEDGKTLTVNNSDVLYISSDIKELPKPDPLKPDLPPEARPLPKPDKPVALPGGKNTLPDFGSSGNSSKVERPESRVFKFMRLLLVNKAGDDSATANSLKRYRSYVHDEKRQYGTRWCAPEDYIKRRDIANVLAKEAASDLKKAETEIEKFVPRYTTRRNSSTGRSERVISDSERRRAQQWLAKKREIEAAGVRGRKTIKQAAMIYPDPEIRVFLIACGEYQAKQYTDAFVHFQDLTKKRPYMTPYQQGYALAAAKRGNYDQAAKTLTHTLKRDPSNSELHDLLRAVLKDAPGKAIHSKVFLEAKETLEATKHLQQKRSGYSSLSRSSSSSEQVRWLFPGKPVTCSEFQLPEPPHDRYSYFQGVAVPIGPQTLLVDRAVVAGASQVIIRIDADTAVVGKVKYASSRDLKVAIVEVVSHAFTPVTLATVEARDKTDLAKALTTNFLPEMGESIRQQGIKFKDLLAGNIPADKRPLQPGESGAPLFSGTGELLGFLTGWTDCFEDDPELSLVDHKELTRTVTSANKPPRKYGSSPTIDIEKLPKAKGNTFLVYAIRGDRFLPEK